MRNDKHPNWSQNDPKLPPTVHRGSLTTSLFRDGCNSSASSENRQWIERRSCSFFDAQRRSREQKFVTVQPPRLLDRSLEIEIIENVYAHRGNYSPSVRGSRTCGIGRGLCQGIAEGGESTPAVAA